MLEVEKMTTQALKNITNMNQPLSLSQVQQELENMLHHRIMVKDLKDSKVIDQKNYQEDVQNIKDKMTHISKEFQGELNKLGNLLEEKISDLQNDLKKIDPFIRY